MQKPVKSIKQWLDENVNKYSKKELPIVGSKELHVTAKSIKDVMSKYYKNLH